jgi:hypothetical protein
MKKALDYLEAVVMATSILDYFCNGIENNNSNDISYYLPFTRIQ